MTKMSSGSTPRSQGTPKVGKMKKMLLLKVVTYTSVMTKMSSGSTPGSQGTAKVGQMKKCYY